MQRNRMKESCYLAGIATLAMAVATPAQAQAETAGNGGLDQIIVTAQKRSENLQTAPLAISAVTADTIQQRGIVDVTSLTAVATDIDQKPPMTTPINARPSI